MQITLASPITLASRIIVLLFAAMVPCAAAAEQAPVANLAPPSAAMPAASQTAAPLVVNNRTVFVFRGVMLGLGPRERAEGAIARIDSILARGGPGAVTLRHTSEGWGVEIDHVLGFLVAPSDIGATSDEALDEAAQRAAAKLRDAIDVGRDSHNLRLILVGLGFSALASLIYAGIVIAIFAGKRRIERGLSAAVQKHAAGIKLGGVAAISAGEIPILTKRAVDVVSWLFALMATYVWLAFVLERFAYTRPWGEALGSNLLSLFEQLVLAVVGSIPGLVVVALILLLARGAMRLTGAFFDRIQHGGAAIGSLDSETVIPTRRITTVLIWIFALAMAYPYLPGAQTDAFKGLSVLAGLMLSLGASNVVGRALSGLTLMYSRVLKRGEYVRIGDVEGTVKEIGFLITRLQTGLGEEVILPNSHVASTTTHNFSRAAGGHGFVLHTGVTIGYATPWRQVHAMLLEAARRTPEVLAEPSPYVVQIALSDFYVEYRLVALAGVAMASRRAETMNLLLANIQDVFNEHGVQIMSPHYIADPDHPQIVPKERWFEAPASRPPESSA